MEEDPLEELFVDKNEINREKLREALKPYLGIDKDTGDPVFKSGFSDLSGKKRVVLFLLYRQALVALEKINYDEVGVEARTISERTGVNYKTVRSQLSLTNYILNDKNRGGHYIPASSLAEAVEEVVE